MRRPRGYRTCRVIPHSVLPCRSALRLPDYAARPCGRRPRRHRRADCARPSTITRRTRHGKRRHGLASRRPAQFRNSAMRRDGAPAAPASILPTYGYVARARATQLPALPARTQRHASPSQRPPRNRRACRHHRRHLRGTLRAPASHEPPLSHNHPGRSRKRRSRAQRRRLTRLLLRRQPIRSPSLPPSWCSHVRVRSHPRKIRSRRPASTPAHFFCAPRSK